MLVEFSLEANVELYNSVADRPSSKLNGRERLLKHWTVSLLILPRRISFNIEANSEEN